MGIKILEIYGDNEIVEKLSQCVSLQGAIRLLHGGEMRCL